MRSTRLLLPLTFFACIAPAFAQFPGGGGAQPSSGNGTAATILPGSGRNNQAGSAAATEQPVPGTTTSVNTLNPTVTISGPYSGSVRSTATMPFSGKLSFADALKRGLTYNLGSVASRDTLRQDNAQIRAVRSALLPNINGSLTETLEETDLAAFGLRISVPGFHFPTVVGPYNYFALQGGVSQNLANLTAVDNYRSAKATARASRYSLDDARDAVTLAVGGLYLQVLAAQARVDSAQAQLNTANAVFHQSNEQHHEGVLGKLNLDQSQLQTLAQQQQIITLRNDLAKQKINLARLIGLPPNADYQLTDKFSFTPAPVQTVEDAINRAQQQRSDLKAAQAQVDAAAKSLAAVRAEHIPSLSLSGYYETIGTNPGATHGAFSVVGTLNIPIWQGGKIEADVAQAKAVLAQRQAELDDTRDQVEAEIRETYLDLQAASGQVEVAQKNLQVAQETLEMARARMQAGVINTVEVVQAQQTVSSAQLDVINSVFAHNLAKLSLARELGQASNEIPALLKPQAQDSGTQQ